MIDDRLIQSSLESHGWEMSCDEGRLMLAELLLKAGAGYYNSQTEEGFMSSFGLLNSDRRLNRKGMKFLTSMFYASSNKRPAAYYMMRDFRL